MPAEQWPDRPLAMVAEHAVYGQARHENGAGQELQGDAWDGAADGASSSLLAELARYNAAMLGSKAMLLLRLGAEEGFALISRAF